MKRILLSAVVKRARSARAMGMLINVAGFAAVAALACMCLCGIWPSEVTFLAGCAFGALSAGLVAIAGGLLQ